MSLADLRRMGEGRLAGKTNCSGVVEEDEVDGVEGELEGEDEVDGVEGELEGEDEVDGVEGESEVAPEFPADPF